METDKKSIMPYVWKIDGFSRPNEDLKGQLYFRYNAKFPKPRKYADFEYTQPEYFVKITTPDTNATVVNDTEDIETSSEGVVPARDNEYVPNMPRRSQRLTAPNIAPTRVA